MRRGGVLEEAEGRGGTQVDRAKQTVKLSLRGEQVLQTLRAREELSGRSDNRKEACAWHPEYGSWMVEGTPRLPFGGFVRDLRRVELSLRLRRRRLLAALEPDEIVPTVSAFPLMVPPAPVPAPAPAPARLSRRGPGGG